MYGEIIRDLSIGGVRSELLDRFQYVFFAGDLNYRIDLNQAQVTKHIEQRQWNELYRHDQLAQAQLTGAAFCNFNEAPIQFAPTFKFHPADAKTHLATLSECDPNDDHDDNDTNASDGRRHAQNESLSNQSTSGIYSPRVNILSLSSEDVRSEHHHHRHRAYNFKRIPAYCDRILWYNSTGTVRCLQYNSISNDCFSLSDHDPVFARFVATITPDYVPRPLNDHARLAPQITLSHLLVDSPEVGSAELQLRVSADFLASPAHAIVPKGGGSVKPITLQPVILYGEYLEMRSLLIVLWKDKTEIGER
jgi:hypothetical protein